MTIKNKQEAKSPNVENLDLFGNAILDKKRSMRDFFIVPPFSVLNTLSKDWIYRKRRWHGLISDKGESREGTLFQTKGDDDVSVKFREYRTVSILDPVLAEIMCKWFCATGFNILDPFAGDTVFGYVSSYFGMNFTGIELRKEQAELNNKRIQQAGFLQSKYINDSSENMEKYIGEGSQDFIFSCPPYMDLEVYSDNPGDLSNMNPNDFFVAYRNILTKTYKALKENRFACLVVSEVRGKNGSYNGLVPKTIEIMESAGFLYWNEIILVNYIGTLPLRCGRPMSYHRKVGRQHQNVLIFYKGKQEQIKHNYPILITPNKYYD